MDDAWAIEVLEWWIEHAMKARAVEFKNGSNKYYDFGWVGTKQVNELREREDQTREVLARVTGSKTLPDILPSFGGNDAVGLPDGVEACRYALGRAKTGAETRARLGSAAPTMAADALHPTIWDAASKLWDDGHHGQAVQRAATFLNADIQDKTGRRDVSDAALMQEVFSMAPPSNDKPRLRWPGKDDDLTVKARRVGILNFAQGIYSEIRNPATHSVDDLPRQEALEQLAALSVLARWIDGCNVIRLIPTKTAEPKRPATN